MSDKDMGRINPDVHPANPLGNGRARGCPTTQASNSRRALQALSVFGTARSAVSSKLRRNPLNMSSFAHAVGDNSSVAEELERAQRKETEAGASQFGGSGPGEGRVGPSQARPSRIPVPGSFSAIPGRREAGFPSFDASKDPYASAREAAHHQRKPSDPFEYDNMTISEEDGSEQVSLGLPGPISPVKIRRAPPARPNLGQHLSKLSITGTGDFGLGIWTQDQTESPSKLDDLFTSSVKNEDLSQNVPASKGKHPVYDPDRTPRPDDAHAIFGGKNPSAITIANITGPPINSKDPTNPFPTYNLTKRLSESRDIAPPRDTYKEGYEKARKRLGELYMKCAKEPIQPSPDLLDFEYQRSYRGSNASSPTSSFNANTPMFPLTVIDSNSSGIAGPRDASSSFGSMRSVTSPIDSVPFSPTEARRPAQFQRSNTGSSAAPSYQSSFASDSAHSNNPSDSRNSTSSTNSDDAAQAGKWNTFVRGARDNEWSDQTNDISLYFIANWYLSEEANPKVGVMKDGSLDIRKLAEKEEARIAANAIEDDRNEKIRIECRTQLLDARLTPAERTQAMGRLKAIHMQERERLSKQELTADQCAAAWAVVFMEWAQKRDLVKIKAMRARYKAQHDEWVQGIAEMESKEELRRRLAAEKHLEEQNAETNRRDAVRRREGDAKIKAFKEGKPVSLDKDTNFRMTVAARRESVMQRMSAFNAAKEQEVKMTPTAIADARVLLVQHHARVEQERLHPENTFAALRAKEKELMAEVLKRRKAVEAAVAESEAADSAAATRPRPSSAQQRRWDELMASPEAVARAPSARVPSGASGTSSMYRLYIPDSPADSAVTGADRAVLEEEMALHERLEETRRLAAVARARLWKSKEGDEELIRAAGKGKGKAE